MKFQAAQQGFIALTSVVVISALLVIIGASLGLAGFFSRYNILDTEFKDESVGLAESCAEIARIAIVNDSNYTGNQNYLVGNGNPQQQCKVVSVTHTGSVYTVKAQGVHQNSYSNIQALFTRGTNDVTVDSWKEVAKF